MANKHKPRPGGPGTTADLKARIDRTRREGKFQQALELAKQLHKAEPTPANLELLKEVYFQRAVQLRTQGYSRDASTVLEVASRLDEKNAAWLHRLAAEMARCGEVARSLALAGQLSDPAHQAALLAQLADGALLKGKEARNALPPALQTEYDRVVEAFGFVEAGQDDRAREALQAIGLRSPFLEWKLLLRGFQAYYAQDDDRALENWQRLGTDRIPFRLAAPFRAAIDPAYRQIQPQATQGQLQQQFDQLQASSVQRLTRDLRKALGQTRSSAGLYRTTESLMSVLKQEAPQMVPRLARVLYWSIPQAGPDTIARHRRVFGSPPDDRNFHRIQAIAQEQHGTLDEAHQHWRAYEAEIASQTDAWPEDQRSLARALIWLRMADNAAKVPTEKQLKKMPQLFRGLTGMPEPLDPSADECLRRALALAPTLLEAHRKLFANRLKNEDTAKAIAAGEKLLELFPDHVETLEELADLQAHMNRPRRAIELLERALRHNPLSRDLRRKMQTTQMACARQFSEKSEFDEARVCYRAALTYGEPDDLCSLCCRWAAAEMKAGDIARADELLRQARTRCPGELVITYILLVEANRLALGNTIKTRYTREFNKEIAGAGTPAVAVELVSFLRGLMDLGVDYHGQKSHTKKIWEYTDRIDRSAFDENQLKELIDCMAHMEAPTRLMARWVSHARGTYPRNPYFPYYEAIHRMGDDPEDTGRDWHLQPLFDMAERLARGLPADPELKAMLDDISRRRQMLALLNPFMNFPFSFFGGGPEEFFGDENEDDEDGW